jgi:hypothetical protein
VTTGAGGRFLGISLRPPTAAGEAFGEASTFVLFGADIWHRDFGTLVVSSRSRAACGTPAIRRPPRTAPIAATVRATETIAASS